MKDRAFLTEAPKLSSDVAPMTDEETRAAIPSMLSTPTSVIAEVQAELGSFRYSDLGFDHRIGHPEKNLAPMVRFAYHAIYAWLCNSSTVRYIRTRDDPDHTILST